MVNGHFKHFPIQDSLRRRESSRAEPETRKSFIHVIMVLITLSKTLLIQSVNHIYWTSNKMPSFVLTPTQLWFFPITLALLIFQTLFLKPVYLVVCLSFFPSIHLSIQFPTYVSFNPLWSTHSYNPPFLVPTYPSIHLVINLTTSNLSFFLVRQAKLVRHANDHAMTEGVRQERSCALHLPLEIWRKRETNRSLVIDPFANNRPFSGMSVKNAN